MRGRGASRGRGVRNVVPIKADDLDDEMDSYFKQDPRKVFDELDNDMVWTSKAGKYRISLDLFSLGNHIANRSRLILVTVYDMYVGNVGY